jgi:hypothetical protein
MQVSPVEGDLFLTVGQDRCDQNNSRIRSYANAPKMS